MSEPLELDAPETATALRDLMASQGWQILTAYAQREWGAHAIVRELDARIADGLDLETVGRKLMAQRDGVHRLLTFPAQTIAKIEAHVEAAKGQAPVVRRRA